MDDEPEVCTHTYQAECIAKALRHPERAAVPSVEGDDTVFGECWVENVYRLERHMLRPDSLVVDVGANVGAFTLLALAMEPTVQVLAVEPDEENAGILEANLELNGWADRVDVMCCGMGESPGRAHLLASGSAARTVADADGQVTVATFMDMVGALEVDFLKLDCEGAEYGIIRGMRRDGALEQVRWIAMEFHETGDEEWGQMVADLTPTHAVNGIIGCAATGGMLWAHRNDV